MTIKEMYLSIGQTGLLDLEGFKVPAKILDVKQAFGNTRFLVTVINGEGEKWVNAERFFIKDLQL